MTESQMSAPNREVTITFEPQASDWELWTQYRDKQLASSRRMTKAMAYLSAVVQVGVSYSVAVRNHAAHPIYYALGALAGYATLFAIATAWTLRRRPNLLEVATQSVEFDGDTFSYGTVQGRRSVPVRVLALLERMDGQFVIGVPEGQVIVPVRAFESPSALVAFGDRLRASYMRQADTQPVRRTIAGYPVSVTYRLTQTDIVRAYYRGYAREHFQSSDGFVAIGGAIAAVIVAAVFYWQLPPARGTIAASFLLVPAVLLFLYRISPAYALSIARHYHETTQMRTLAFGPMGMALDDGAGVITVPWTDISSIRVHGEILIVKCIMPKCTRPGQQNLRAKEALIVPLSAFLSPSAAEEAIAAMIAYRQGDAAKYESQSETWPPAPTDVG